MTSVEEIKMYIAFALWCTFVLGITIGAAVG